MAVAATLGAEPVDLTRCWACCRLPGAGGIRHGDFRQLALARSGR